jgi:AraC-like DNA-binding protein
MKPTAPSFTVIPATKTRAFTACHYREPSFRFLWHYHPEWEITWTRNGRGLRHIGRSVEQFEPGDLVLLAGNIPHTWFSSPDQIGDAECSVIHFLPSIWGADFWKMPETRALKTLCDQAVRGIKFEGPGVHEVGRKMEALARQDSPGFGAFAGLIEIFHLLLELPARPLNLAAQSGETMTNSRLQELLGWIEQRVAEPLTQGQVASHLRMSPSAFSRWFKQQMGCVFQRYLSELRVARACALLTSSSTSITEAAFQSGFNNLSNFNRRFQEVTGLTPRQFRRQYHGKTHKGG